jgi:ABC-type sugar transport system permease subunit
VTTILPRHGRRRPTIHDFAERQPRNTGKAKQVLFSKRRLSNRSLDWPFEALQRALGAARMPYVFVAPNLLVFGIFVAAPMLLNVWYATTGGTQLMPADRPFVGAANFAELLDCDQFGVIASCRQDRFWRAVANTAWFVAFQVVGLVAVSLITALVLNRRMAWRGFFRAVFFYPVLLSPVVVALIWKWLLQPDGLFNAIIVGTGGSRVPFLLDPAWSFAWTVVVSIWASMGFYTLILLAGLQAIPPDLYEAAGNGNGTPHLARPAPHHAPLAHAEPAGGAGARPDPRRPGLRRNLRPHRRRPRAPPRSSIRADTSTRPPSPTRPTSRSRRRRLHPRRRRADAAHSSPSSPPPPGPRGDDPLPHPPPRRRPRRLDPPGLPRAWLALGLVVSVRPRPLRPRPLLLQDPVLASRMFPPSLLPMGQKQITVPGYDKPSVFLVPAPDGSQAARAMVRRIRLQGQFLDPADPAKRPERARLASVTPVRELHFAIENFIEPLRQFSFARFLGNSLFVTVVSTAITLLINAMCAFALVASTQFRGREGIFVFILLDADDPHHRRPARLPDRHRPRPRQPCSGRHPPPAATPTGVFLLRQYMLTIPDELLDAARMDHASEWRLFRRIILPPAAGPRRARHLLGDVALERLPLAPHCADAPREFHAATGPGRLPGRTPDPVALSPGDVVTLLPVTIVFLLQKYVTTGIASAGMK